MRTATIAKTGLAGLVALSACANANRDATSGAQETQAQPGDVGDDGTNDTGAVTSPGTGVGGETSQPGDGTVADESADGGPVAFDLGELPDVPGGETCIEDVDVVFVMDVSTTMGTFLSTLADEIVAVDQALQAYDLPSPPHYGLVVFVDDMALLNAGAPYADANALRDDFVYWSGFTASNEQVAGGNSNYTWAENSIDALYAAATTFQWRDAQSTARIIIHTTDDTFWNGPTTGNGVSIVHSYAETVDALQAGEIRVFSFADDIGGSCACDDVTPGWSAPYMAQPPIPEATDGSVFDIGAVLSGGVSLSDAITASVEESICNPYTPVG